jgi:hypothetical protein
MKEFALKWRKIWRSLPESNIVSYARLPGAPAGRVVVMGRFPALKRRAESYSPCGAQNPCQ